MLCRIEFTIDIRSSSFFNVLSKTLLCVRESKRERNYLNFNVVFFFKEELTDVLIKGGQLVCRQRGTDNLDYALKLHKTAVLH